MKKIIAGLLMCLLLNSVVAQTTFYDQNTIQKIEITFTQSDWDYELDTAKAGFDSYVMASKLKLNGVEFDSIGVKYKGNSSYNAANNKNPLHIELDTYKKQSYQGIKDIKLSNGYADPSLIREVLSYDIISKYMDAPRSNFVQVYINGRYIGLYTNDESITKSFCARYFYTSNGTFVKCNPIGTATPNTKSNLKFINADSTSYFKYYEMKSATGWDDLVKLCDTVTNFPAYLENVLDVDRVIWMLALNNIMVNLDSYNGVFAQNYYLYKDNNNRFNPIMWDLNMSFGGFPYEGTSNSSMKGLKIPELQKLPIISHSNDPYWPLIKAVLGNASYKKMYVAHLRTIMNEIYVSDYYKTKANELMTLIDSAVVADTNKFYSNAQFKAALTDEVPNGSFAVPGIQTLVEGRVAYLQSLSDFTDKPPVITDVAPDDSLPALNGPVTITAKVTNATSNTVYLGYRALNSDKFVRVQMMDDGLNNDGAAGDGVFGATITMKSTQLQYYIYAENATSGIFSPERAEYEFYKLKSGVHTADVGQVVINEFLASNKTGEMNEKGIYEDWIELYNTTSKPLNLDGVSLSDSYTNPTKFTFPANTVIPGNGYLMIWADENAITTSYIHCNFKLSASGEQLILSNSAGKVLDSISFGSQLEDISEARCPNGTGEFKASVPTFKAGNCVDGIFENGNKTTVLVYPNPAFDNVTVVFDPSSSRNTVSIFNMMGQQIVTFQSSKQSENIDVSSLSSGIYLIRVNDQQAAKVEVKN